MCSAMDKSGGRSPTDVDEAGTVRAQYDWSSAFPSTGVVETVSRAVGRDPKALEPLYESIDPDALDAIVGSFDSQRPRDDTTVSFVFADRRVTVSGSGEVLVRPTQ